MGLDEKRKIKRIKKDMAAMKSEIDERQSEEIREIGDRLSKLQARMDGFESLATALRNDVQMLRAEVADFMKGGNAKPRKSAKPKD